MKQNQSLYFPRNIGKSRLKLLHWIWALQVDQKLFRMMGGAGGGWQPFEYGRWHKKLFKIKQTLSEIFEIKCEEVFPYIEDEWKLKMFISNLFPNIAAWPVPWTSSRNNQLGMEVWIKDRDQLFANSVNQTPNYYELCIIFKTILHYICIITLYLYFWEEHMGFPRKQTGSH